MAAYAVRFTSCRHVRLLMTTNPTSATRSPQRTSQSIVIAALVSAAWLSVARSEDQDLREKWEATYEREILPIVQEFCIDCHQGEEPDGNFNIARYTTGKKVSEKVERWARVGKRMRLKEMPPEGSPQLSGKQKRAMHRWLDARPQQDLCGSLATDETQAWYRGYVMSRRLTRTEYQNAIRDLLGVHVEDEINLPSDGSGGEGFDTAGNALFTSAIHIQRYLQVATSAIESVVTRTEPGGTDVDQTSLHEARIRLLGDISDAHSSPSEHARTIIEGFARRAWRRPISAEEVDRLLPLFESAYRRHEDFVVAIREPLKAILVSANFLFVVEPESPEGGIQKLTQHQLATRLALFIWSSIPDEELMRLADEGQLETDAQIIEQTRRMLSDPKSRALADNFGIQWLGLTSFLSEARPDTEVYPAYNRQLASDLREEAVRTIDHLFSSNGSLLELLSSSHVHVNGQLASHYGIDLPKDAPWQRFQTADHRYGGVVTLGAVLMNNSYPRRTSPVLRGRWILEEVLGGEVPPPPPDVPALDDTDGIEARTLRERLELHRKNPECAACHNRMDPLGFGLENFDALGRWRDTDQGKPIDSSGRLPSGNQFEGPGELKKLLVRRSDEFVENFVRKMLGFALGRELNKFDECVVDDCQQRLGSMEYRAHVVIETIVTSYPFQHRYFKPKQP